MIRINQLKIPVKDDNPITIKEAIAKRLRINSSKITSFTPAKRSVDARKKPNIVYIYNLDIVLSCDELKIVEQANDKDILLAPEKSHFSIPRAALTKAPIVCGMGPAGLFCAHALAKAGLNPILLERGKDIDARVADTETFLKTSTLNTESNIQFGEGGAGTFSDGKLTTGTSNIRLNYILETFVRHGAPESILYDSKPHIGTDLLREIIKSMRQEIISLGGQVLFETKFVGFQHKNNRITSITAATKGETKSIECDKLVLAIGHSARDTFEILHENNMHMQQKPFSMGVRIEHKQHTINMTQYGTDALGAADYKLSVKTSDGRGVYTFCMCPGGHVIAAASENGGVVTNGMSYHVRDGENANAALLCDVYPSDFESEHPLAGMYLQRKYEQKAYRLGGSTYAAPATLVCDYLSHKASAGPKSIMPTYRPSIHWCDISECLPDYINHALREALPLLGKKLDGFDDEDAVLTAIESRSSSPVRILRNEALESNYAGIYPCGEGAGYAGGIMSAASDGLRVAMEIISKNTI